MTKLQSKKLTKYAKLQKCLNLKVLMYFKRNSREFTQASAIQTRRLASVLGSSRRSNRNVLYPKFKASQDTSFTNLMMFHRPQVSFAFSNKMITITW